MTLGAAWIKVGSLTGARRTLAHHITPKTVMERVCALEL